MFPLPTVLECVRGAQVAEGEGYRMSTTSTAAPREPKMEREAIPSRGSWGRQRKFELEVNIIVELRLK